MFSWGDDSATDNSTFARRPMSTTIGRYRCAVSGAGNTYGHPENILALSPYVVSGVETYDRITAQVTVAGSAGALVRPAVYRVDETTGLPTDLILDPGTIDGTVVAVAQLTINQTLQPGTYAIGYVIQGGAATRPTMQVTIPIVGLISTIAPPVGIPLNAVWSVTIAAGPLPNTLVGVSSSGIYAPMVSLRRSA